MHAELQVLSPLVLIREVNFLRFCKQHAEGIWAAFDVSIDTIQETPGAPTFVNCMRLPFGCVLQDMPNGYSKVNELNMQNETRAKFTNSIVLYLSLAWVLVPNVGSPPSNAIEIRK